MSATRRCSICAINYPTYTMTCPVCEESTTLFGNMAPHPDWKERSDALRAELEETESPHLPGIWRLGNGFVTVDQHGQLWLPAEAVLNSRVQNRLEPFELVEINHQLYEIQGWHEQRREYWVRMFDPTCPDTFPESWLGD